VQVVVGGLAQEAGQLVVEDRLLLEHAEQVAGGEGGLPVVDLDRDPRELAAMEGHRHALPGDDLAPSCPSGRKAVGEQAPQRHRQGDVHEAHEALLVPRPSLGLNRAVLPRRVTGAC